MPIHPTAIVDGKAEIDPTATIGPYAIIEGEVRIGPNAVIYPQAYISGWVTIGAGCQVHPGAVLGHLPQDFHFSGARTFLRIGDGTIIREHASIHRGTQPESETVIGKNCLIMGYSHIGHNCEVADEVKIANMAALSGHVSVGRGSFVSGYSLIHQFVRIGEYAMIAGGTRLGMDAPSFFTCIGESECLCVNVIGVRRAGFTQEEIAELRRAYRLLYRSGKTFQAAVAELAGTVHTPAGRRLVEFISFKSKRGICGPPVSGRMAAGTADEEPGEGPTPT
jgi:UDP-N-acetylglucosamine acyltransferase